MALTQNQDGMPATLTRIVEPVYHAERGVSSLERVTRIELALTGWKPVVLPLNYTRRVGVTGIEPAL